MPAQPTKDSNSICHYLSMDYTILMRLATSLPPEPIRITLPMRLEWVWHLGLQFSEDGRATGSLATTSGLKECCGEMERFTRWGMSRYNTQWRRSSVRITLSKSSCHKEPRMYKLRYQTKMHSHCPNQLCLKGIWISSASQPTHCMDCSIFPKTIPSP